MVALSFASLHFLLFMKIAAAWACAVFAYYAIRILIVLGIFLSIEYMDRHSHDPYG